ncbi:hypothetical protein CLAIMM_06774 [Cladophialophora immunda]|nr:hypothetical protein CLAIMM_06774 [Cladophialophora immunda]
MRDGIDAVEIVSTVKHVPARAQALPSNRKCDIDPPQSLRSGKHGFQLDLQPDNEESLKLHCLQTNLLIEVARTVSINVQLLLVFRDEAPTPTSHKSDESVVLDART